MNIYIIGFMGTGKTTIGRVLGKRLGRQVLDTDEGIVAKEGRTIQEIFESDGEVYFRDVESELLAHWSRLKKCIITTGGGIVLRPSNRERMFSEGFVISLYAPEDVIVERVSRSTKRPLVTGDDGEQKVHQLMLERAGMYDNAHMWIDTSKTSVIETVDFILENPVFPIR